MFSNFKKWLLTEMPLGAWDTDFVPENDPDRTGRDHGSAGPFSSFFKSSARGYVKSDKNILQQPDYESGLAKQFKDGMGYTWNVLAYESYPDETISDYRYRIINKIKEKRIPLEDRITVVKEGSSGDPLRPQMMAHIVGHALLSGNHLFNYSKIEDDLMRVLSHFMVEAGLRAQMKFPRKVMPTPGEYNYPKDPSDVNLVRAYLSRIAYNGSNVLLFYCRLFDWPSAQALFKKGSGMYIPLVRELLYEFTRSMLKQGKITLSLTPWATRDMTKDEIDVNEKKYAGALRDRSMSNVDEVFLKQIRVDERSISNLQNALENMIRRHTSQFLGRIIWDVRGSDDTQSGFGD